MGLTGIHHPDALCHFNRVTHCPWCGKEGQNEGTVINHLLTVHYRLGLMCKKCFGCPSTSSETICHTRPEGLPTFRGGRPQQVILFGITTSRRCIRSISPKWKPEWRIQGRFWHPLAALLGIIPAPLAWPWRRTRWRRCHLPTQHIPSPQSSCTKIRWPLPSANPELHKKSTEMLNFYELKVKS